MVMERITVSAAVSRTRRIRNARALRNVFLSFTLSLKVKVRRYVEPGTSVRTRHTPERRISPALVLGTPHGPVRKTEALYRTCTSGTYRWTVCHAVSRSDSFGFSTMLRWVRFPKRRSRLIRVLENLCNSSLRLSLAREKGVKERGHVTLGVLWVNSE